MFDGERQMPLLGTQLYFLLIFRFTSKSPKTIVGNLDSCVSCPGSFSEAMHLQFQLSIA